jgi:sec-independent protein translocase protein TatA
MGELLQPMHLLVIGVILVVLFGGKKLPELGKGLGEGLRGFKTGLKGVTEEDADTSAADEKKRREELEAKAYQEAKLAAEARIAAEARVAAEQKAAQEVVIK